LTDEALGTIALAFVKKGETDKASEILFKARAPNANHGVVAKAGLALDLAQGEGKAALESFLQRQPSDEEVQWLVSCHFGKATTIKTLKDIAQSVALSATVQEFIEALEPTTQEEGDSEKVEGEAKEEEEE